MTEGTIDSLVLTAANRAQARGYEAQLAARERDGRLRNVRNRLVVADPRDRRVGSGGATFVVLHELARRLRGRTRSHAANSFDGQRILIIHSGGDSRRLPAYAAEGKIFVPVPRTLDGGQSATLFDLILADLSPLVRDGRVLIATGDVLLGVGAHNPDLSAPGMVGVTFPGHPAVASRHGVYMRNASGRVTDFLQKPDLAIARRRRAIDRRGRVLIDTGVLSLDSSSAAQWTGASASMVDQMRAGRGEPIDLYSDLLPSLYGGDATTRRFDPFRIPFHAAIVPPCDFLHIGSTRELLSIATKWGSRRHRAVTLNTVTDAPLSQHSTSFVESSRITRRTRIGNHGMLVGFPGGLPLHLDDHLGMVFLPIGRSDWSCVAFGVNDDFKTPLGRGGTICNASISKHREHSYLRTRFAETSLWDIPCWVVGSLHTTLRNAQRIAASLPLLSAGHHMSMAQLMSRVNLHRLLAHREALRAESNAAIALSQLRAGDTPPAHLVISAPPALRTDLSRLINSRLSKERDPFSLARLHHLAALLKPARSSAHDTLAFRAIADGVATTSPPPPPARRAALSRNEVVTVTAPVRIDLCGGWSDTPPICHELGGTVVNAAITLDGRHPVQVTARLIEDPVYRLRSEDLARSVTVRTLDDARRHFDPHDWAALPKAALILAGITPGRGSLRERLRRFGGGIELTMSVEVPKGSGLGTSSILGAAVLACLDRVCGRATRVNSLMDRTSVLEQMMSTAGGWQDQAGGLTPGFKILRTRAGPDQAPRVSPIHPPARALRALQARSLLYYTGQRRLARDILQGVVRRYLSGEGEAVRIIRDLKSAAEETARALSRGDIDAFARGVLRNWELKKAIDPGSTNEPIEAILSPLAARLSGYELAGAGGGGFIFMIARSPRDAAAVTRHLSARRGTGGHLVEFDLDQQGLTVEVTAASRG